MVTNPQILHVPRTQLRPGPWQPRQLFDEERLIELAASLRVQGVLTPLRVIPAPEGSGFLIVAGERRWRASALAGIDELPCIVLNAPIGERRLRELAVLDNLHRADLRPGEEARAIAELSHLGVSQREIAERLGKSPGWVSQRLAVAKLPDLALKQLNLGAITREEALALSRLIDYPELVQACLEPDGKRLKARLGGHVPEGLGERVLAVRRALEMERQREAWATKMRAQGHRVLDEKPGDNDRRYVKLLSGSEMSRAHQEAKLPCEVWAWEYGRPVRYCDNPSALFQAMKKIRKSDPAEQNRQEEYCRVLERESARDAIISAWLATTRGVETWELGMLARERIRTLTSDNDRLLARLGGWLGATGDLRTRAAVAERELASASERRLLQLWFLLEVAQATSYAVIPTWLLPWLSKLGFVDPYNEQPPREGAQAKVLRGAECDD